MKRILKTITAFILAAALIVPAAAYDGWTKAQSDAHDIANILRTWGYTDDNPMIQAAKAWWQSEEDAKQEVPPEPSQGEIVSYTTAEQRAEYPVAAQVWERLRSAGYSEYVAAGILGNMMAECGGQTLTLHPGIGGYGYAGICMWYTAYTNGRIYLGCGLDEQLDYLLDTIEWAINFDGDYSYFLSITDPAKSAYYFTVHYERGAWSYQRAVNAQNALAYFGGDYRQ